MKFLSKAICCFYCKTFHICNLLSHWALSNCCDPLWDAFHTPMIKIAYTPHILPTSTPGVVQDYFTHSIPQNINSMLFMAILSKLQGHGLKKRGTRRSKAFKREIWTHEGPMCFKRKLAHVQRNKREIAHERSSYTIHKNSTHLHILIKVYDLFLLRIRSLI